MELNALLASPIVLPSIPKVVALLLSELDREVPDLKNITQLIGTDPALTTRVLQTANTPLFKLSGKVHSASEALALLDLAHIRHMAADAASAASLKGIPGVNLPQFWAYSLNVAKLSRSLPGVTRQNQGAAFTCGLIHAIGELVMHAGMPAEMAVLNKELGPLDLKRARAEMLRFGLARGARAETLSGLCGLGDLVLTCSSTSSRNFSLGKALGEGQSAAEALAGKSSVAEGAATAPVLAELARAGQVDMPIVEAVARLLAGEAPARAVVSELLARPLKAEREHKA